MDPATIGTILSLSASLIAKITSALNGHMSASDATAIGKDLMQSILGYWTDATAGGGWIHQTLRWHHDTAEAAIEYVATELLNSSERKQMESEGVIRAGELFDYKTGDTLQSRRKAIEEYAEYTRSYTVPEGAIAIQKVTTAPIVGKFVTTIDVPKWIEDAGIYIVPEKRGIREGFIFYAGPGSYFEYPSIVIFRDREDSNPPTTPQAGAVALDTTAREIISNKKTTASEPALAGLIAPILIISAIGYFLFKK